MEEIKSNFELVLERLKSKDLENHNEEKSRILILKVCSINWINLWMNVKRII